MEIWGKTGSLDPKEHGIRINELIVLHHLQKTSDYKNSPKIRQKSNIFAKKNLNPENCIFITG